jgi:ferric-dicitrate binding protein FerR (iron transport regulator)
VALREFLQQRPRQPPVRRWRVASLATVLILVLIIIAFWVPETIQIWMSDYHAGSGKQWMVPLADGTQMFLNAQTVLMGVLPHSTTMSTLS